MIATPPPPANLADWMQAWGSVLGVLVSGLAVAITGMLLRFEMRARRDEQADSDAAQARLVLARFIGFGRAEESSAGSITSIDYQLRNESDAPVFQVSVHLSTLQPSPQEYTKEYDFLGSHPRDQTSSGFGKLASALIQGRWELGMPVPTAIDNPYRYVALRISFTDAAGLRWTRKGLEPPERIIMRRPGIIARTIAFLRVLVDKMARSGRPRPE